MSYKFDLHKLIAEKDPKANELFKAAINYKITENPNIVDEKQDIIFPSYLFAAADKNNIDLVNFLLDNKANVDGFSTISSEDLTPLIRVARNDDSLLNSQCIEIVKLLLSRGADVNKQSSHGFTAIHSAKFPEMAKVLLDAGAKLDITNNEGKTPFEWALIKSRFDIAKFLYKNGLTENKIDISKIDTTNITLPKDTIEERIFNEAKDGLMKGLLTQLFQKD